MRDNDVTHAPGRLPSHAWPGLYTLLYLAEIPDIEKQVMMDLGMQAVLCAECANLVRGLEGVRVTVWPHDEGPLVNCDRCDIEVESSYGDNHVSDSNMETQDGDT